MSARIGAGKRARPRRRIDVENKLHGQTKPLHSVLRGWQCDAGHLFSTPRRGVSLKGKFRCVGLTDTGKVREHNEDTIAFDADIGLLVLADGMGGYNAGEVASGIAVKTILNLVRESVDRQDLRAMDRESGMSRPSIILRDAIHRANKIIYQTARTQPNCEGMGTTVVSALFFDNKVSVAHVGDSRLYRLRGEKYEQLTMDHSLLQELVDRGFYSAEEAQRAANKNYVTRALGVEPSVDVEVQEVPVQKGDTFALCSDGLSDMVEDDDMHLTLSTFGANLDTVAKQLIQLANDNGGRDNISVVMATVLDVFPARRGIFDKVLGWFG
jgi:protein phosphatase